MSRGPCRRDAMTGGAAHLHTPVGTGHLEPLYAELRALAGPARAVIDAHIASWYVESRRRVGRPYGEWSEPITGEVASAVFFGVDARSSARRLGEARAAAGWREHELRADLVALVRSFGLSLAATGPLMAAAGEGFRSATATIVVDLVARERPRPGARVYDAIERVAGRYGWSEVAPATRFAIVVPRDARLAHRAAAVRAGLRTAPELAGVDAWVWTERSPGAVRPDADRAADDDAAPRRPHQRARRRLSTAHGRGRARDPVMARRFEQLSAVAAAALVVVAAVSVLRAPDPFPERPPGPSGTAVDDKGPPASRDLEPAPAPEPTGDLEASGSPALIPTTAPPPSVELPAAPVAHVEPAPVAHGEPAPAEGVPPPPSAPRALEPEAGVDAPAPPQPGGPPPPAARPDEHDPAAHARAGAAHGPPPHAGGPRAVGK